MEVMGRKGDGSEIYFCLGEKIELSLKNGIPELQGSIPVDSLQPFLRKFLMREFHKEFSPSGEEGGFLFFEKSFPKSQG